jgi:type I restriction-modification system DNA methylase subunit
MDGVDMTFNDPRRLQTLTNFETLLDYLRDELGWPIEVEDLDEATFEYSPQELNINPRYAARITSIKQLRPLVDQQIWGIFFVEFDNNRLPVMALRRILQSLAVSRRQRDASIPAWKREDLLFICVYTSAAEGKVGQRGITFAHFRDEPGSQPELRTFSWDSRETHFYYIRNLNLGSLRWPANDRDVNIWGEQWRRAFTVRHRYTIRTSEKLASQMARQAVIIRELVDDLYEAEGENGVLHELAKDLGKLYKTGMQDETPESRREFADTVAQTITYGVFSAAVQNNEFTLDKLPDAIPNTNPLLKQMLRDLTTEGELDLDELGVGELVDLLHQIDLQAITRDFGRQTGSGSEDPIVHFYEQFLNEYDRQQRVQRGVFYTPDPVVEYIVTAVDQILQRPTEDGGFGIRDGLSSDATITVRVIDEDGNEQKEKQPLVQILDPATGTGTFLAHIINRIERKKIKEDKLPPDAWNSYVANNLLKRLNGFELMMAPYTIAHLKLGLKLAQTGYTFGANERLHIFLTNALEKADNPATRRVRRKHDLLSDEAVQAADVKDTEPIMVVIGNPPYSGHSANEISEDWFKLNDYYFVDGQPLGERNPKWLQDDYVKFIRFGQWRIEQTGEGVLAFISNHGYLDSPTFRGMRQQLMRAFDEIYILDLHGNSRKRETTPDGGKDENVFDIMQGVAIGIFVKRRHNSSEEKPPARVCHRHVWGIREGKYEWLLQSDEIGKSDGWNEIEPQTPFYMFVPQDTTSLVEYQQGWKFTDILRINSVGVVTGKDSKTIAFTDNEAKGLANASGLDTKTIRPILYRPFDVRRITYDRQFLERDRYTVMQHLIGRENMAIITSRLTKGETFHHIQATRNIVEVICMSPKTSNNGFVFPLYEYPVTDEKFDDVTRDWPRTNGRRPNLSKAFVEQVAEKLGLEFVTDGRGDLHRTFGPEDVFHYAYAIFHSRLYRQRYAEQLKIDFPRLPLTTDVELFRQLVMRGVDLVALHLLEDDYEGTYWNRHKEPSPLTQPITRFVIGKNGSTVGAMSKSRAYDQEHKHIYLDTSEVREGSYFEFVEAISAEDANETWEFQVGGYQVLHKWLYDRRPQGAEPGRTLTDEELTHYQRVVVALYHTRKLMDDIDEVIEEHGGFPLPGSSPEDADVQPPPPSDDEVPQETPEEESAVDNGNEEVMEIEQETVMLDEAEQIYNQAEGVEPEQEDTNYMITEPFDPNLIRIRTERISLDGVISRLQHNEIDLAPAFQRMGGIWKDVAQSRLIESLLIRIPLPAFYMDATNEDQWQVIDGLQRLTALKRFVIDNTLKLRGLEFLKLNGQSFNDLDRSLQRRINETQVTLYLVEQGTPDKVKFNIFKRINTGGIPLSGQEIRHALYQGPVTDFLRVLAASDEFKRATNNSVSPMRMADRECVLRFLSFAMIPYQEYGRSEDLDSFLIDRMISLNQMSSEQRTVLDNRFKKAMNRAYSVFAEKAFRKQFKSGRVGPVSKALFEAWSVNLERLSDDEANVVTRRKGRLNNKFIELLADPNFDRAISYSTGNYGGVQYRFSSIERIIGEVLND